MCAAEWFISPRRRHCLETKGLRQGGNKTENKSHCCLKQRFHICFVAPSTGIQREHVVILGLQIDEDSCRQSQVSQCYTKVVAMAQNWPHWKLWLEAVQCTPCGVSQKRRQNVGSAMWTPTYMISREATNEQPPTTTAASNADEITVSHITLTHTARILWQILSATLTSWSPISVTGVRTAGMTRALACAMSNPRGKSTFLPPQYFPRPDACQSSNFQSTWIYQTWTSAVLIQNALIITMSPQIKTCHIPL